jgi:hypothetical protein
MYAEAMWSAAPPMMSNDPVGDFGRGGRAVIIGDAPGGITYCPPGEPYP